MIFIYLFIVGLFFGSFLNVLADRLSRDETILGRSKCESCQHELSFLDLVPVFSYLFLGGKCRYCQKKFSLQYPLSEIFTGVVFVLTWYFSMMITRNPMLHGFHLVFAAVLVVIILADLRYQVIPDQMQISLIVIQLMQFVYINYLVLRLDYMNILQMFANSIIAGLLVMAPLLLVFLLSRGRGMGFGDVKFAFIIGFVLGIIPGFEALYISFVLGGFIGGLLLLLKLGKRKSKIPFGPFLVLGFYLMIFFENDITLLLSRIYRVF